MADDDDFGALYGDAIYTSADAEPEQTTPLPGAGAPEIEGEEDDDDLYGELYDDQEDAAHPPSVAHPKQEQEQEPEAAIPLPDTNDVLGQLGGFSPLQAVPQDGSDEDDDDFNVQLDEPDLDAYEQTRAQALEAKSAAGGGNEDEDDDFNIMLDDPSQSVMGGPDSYSAPHSSKQYVRPGAQIPRAPSLPIPGQQGDAIPAVGDDGGQMHGQGSNSNFGQGVPPPRPPPGAPLPVGAPNASWGPQPPGGPAPPPGAPPPGTPAFRAAPGNQPQQQPDTAGPNLASLRAMTKEQAEFPTVAGPEHAIKLPGQTRVSPEEYKEFLALGHGEIFCLDMDRIVDECAPWRLPGARASDFFNYDMNLKTWKEYCAKVQQYRLEYTMQKKIPTFDSTAASQHQDDGMDMMMGRGGVGMHGGGGGWGSRQGGFQGGAPIPGYGGGIPRGPPQPPRGPPPGGMGGGEYNGGDGSAAISLTGALSSDPIGDGRVLAGGMQDSGHGGGGGMDGWQGGGGGGRGGQGFQGRGGGRGGGRREDRDGGGQMGMRPPQGIVSPMEAMMGGLMGTMNPMMAGMMHFMPGMPPIMGMMGPNAPMPGMQFMPGMAPPPPPPPRPPPRKMEEDDVKEEENGAGEEEGRSVKTESTDHEPKVEANIGDRVVSRSSNGSKAKDSNDRRRRDGDSRDRQSGRDEKRGSDRHGWDRDREGAFSSYKDAVERGRSRERSAGSRETRDKPEEHRPREERTDDRRTHDHRPEDRRRHDRSERKPDDRRVDDRDRSRRDAGRRDMDREDSRREARDHRSSASAGAVGWRDVEPDRSKPRDHGRDRDAPVDRDRERDRHGAGNDRDRRAAPVDRGDIRDYQPSRARDRGTREDERGARVRESAKAREDSSLSKRGRDWPDDQERERSASLSYVLSELKCIPGLTNAILYRDRTPLSSSSGPKIGRRVFSEHQQRPK